ncbi:MAG: kelch repeat-containing protein [Bacteroidota bacterium]
MKRIFSFLILSTLLINTYAQTSEYIWEKKSNFPGGQLDNVIGFTIGNYAYACLGSTSVQFKKDCWKYDPQKDTWEQITSFPGEPRTSAIGFSIGNKGYIGTGLLGSDNQISAKDFWEYDPEKNQWTQKADLPGGGRYGAIGFSSSEKGYVALGASQTTYYNDIFEYDPKTNQWTKKADFPEEGRIDASVFFTENKAYLLLGAQQKNITPKKKDVWEYDTQTNKWVKKAEFPGAPRVAATAFTLNNKGYIYAGFNRATLRYQDVWEYDPATNLWTQKADALCGVRSYAFSFVINNNAFVGTGKKSMFGSNDVWKYGPQSPSITSDNDFAIGATVYFGEGRVPMGAVEVELLNKKNEVVQTTTSNIFGSFLFQNLSKDEDYIVSVKYDPYMVDQKIYMVNRNNKPIATLEKSNDFKYYSAAADAKTALLKIDNNNMRMNLNGKLALNDKSKSPLKNTPVSLISGTQEVVQMTTTDENGAFSFNYLPLDSSLYVSVEPEDLSSLPKESFIVLMDEKANVIKKTKASNPTFKFFTLPPQKNILTKMYVEDQWMQAIYLTKNKCAGSGLSVIENIYFDSNKSVILSDTKGILNKIAISMKTNDNIVIEINAHTDSKGASEANLKLSEERAKSAKQYLVANGVDESRIISKGLGETKLLNKCADNVPCSEEDHAKNRRIEFKVNCKK